MSKTFLGIFADPNRSNAQTNTMIIIIIIIIIITIIYTIIFSSSKKCSQYWKCARF